jgi:hypothetical protein
MRKLILSFIVAVTIPAMALAQSPDAKAKAEEILKKARAAIGDEKKLKELQSISIAGTVRQNFMGRDTESDLEIEMLMPDKVKKTTTNPAITAITALNGDQVWNDFISSMPMGGPGGGPGGPGGFRGPRGIGGPGGLGGPGGMFGPDSPMGAYFQLQARREFYLIALGWMLAAPSQAQVEFAFIGEAPGPEGSKLNVLDGKGANGFTVRLYFDQETNQLIGLSYKAKQMGFGRRGPGGPGGPGGGRGPGGPGGGPGGQQPQGAPAGQPGQGGQPAPRPEPTPEERERFRKEALERFEKMPEVDYRWAFSEYKSVGGLNLPHRLTKLEGGTPNEEWEISKIKINPKLSPDKFVKKEKSPSGN